MRSPRLRKRRKRKRITTANDFYDYHVIIKLYTQCIPGTIHTNTTQFNADIAILFIGFVQISHILSDQESPRLRHDPPLNAAKVNALSIHR